MTHRQTIQEAKQQSGDRRGAQRLVNGVYIGSIVKVEDDRLPYTAFAISNFSMYRRFSVRVIGPDGEWQIYRQVPILNKGGSDLFSTSLAKGIVDAVKEGFKAGSSSVFMPGATVLVAIFGESHSGSGVVILGKVDAVVDPADTKAQTQQSTPAATQAVTP